MGRAHRAPDRMHGRHVPQRLSCGRSIQSLDPCMAIAEPRTQLAIATLGLAATVSVLDLLGVGLLGAYPLRVELAAPALALLAASIAALVWRPSIGRPLSIVALSAFCLLQVVVGIPDYEEYGADGDVQMPYLHLACVCIFWVLSVWITKRAAVAEG